MARCSAHAALDGRAADYTRKRHNATKSSPAWVPCSPSWASAWPIACPN